MLHTETIPIWAWLILIVALGAMLAVRVVNRRKQAEFDRIMRIKRQQNIAEYKAWQWLFGTPKPLRLSDQSKTKPGKD